MTSMFWCTNSIITIRMHVFGICIFFQSIKMVLMHISEKNTLKNQPDINSMVVEKLSYFHLKNFFHIHQLTCVSSSSISFFMVLKKIRSRVLFLVMVMYCAVCLLIYLFQN